MKGEHHERAVEAASHAIYVRTRGAAIPGFIDSGHALPVRHVGTGLLAEDAVDAYHRSLAEQGVRLVDLREVVKMLRARGNLHAAKALERRFGGHEENEPRSRG